VDPGAVRVVGLIDHADMPALYSMAAALVFPSYYESFGIPLVEAMACGCPVINTALHGSGVPWVSRDAETGIFIGRHDLYRKGIASEAVRLRMAYAWNELGLHRTHNWIALPNRGSWRANQKSGYAQIGTFPRSWFRSGEWVDEWIGEAFPHTYPSENLPSPWRDERSKGK
jgi:hypothetical protein